MLLRLTTICCSKKQPKETEVKNYQLETPWKLDSISGDSVLLPFDNEFDELVNAYLSQIEDEQDIKFLYNVHFDTIYRWNAAKWVQDRSVRGVVISRINNKEMLEKALNDSTFIKIWDQAKQEYPEILTNTELIRDRLTELSK